MTKLIKSVAVLFALSATAGASPIDDAVNSYKNVVQISPVSYKGKPVYAEPEDICALLGYFVAVESSVVPMSEGDEYYSLNRNGSTYGFRQSVVPKYMGLSALQSVTCAKP